MPGKICFQVYFAVRQIPTRTVLMPASIGIDFGTCNLRLATLGDEGQFQTLGRPISVRDVAGLAPGPDPPIKLKLDKATQMGNELVLSADLVLRILRFLKTEAENLLKDDVGSCVVNIPWQAGNIQRELLRSTTQKAGFGGVRLVNDSAAVALSQCIPSEGERKLLIYSLGAGSLEVAIAIRSRGTYRELSAGSLEGISGNSLTWRLFDSLWNEFFPEIKPGTNGIEYKVWQIAENAKVMLSSQEQVRLEMVESGNNPVYTRQRFESLIGTDLSRSIDLCQEMVSKAGLNTPRELDEIWLAGKSTQIPMLSTMVANWSGKKPKYAEEYAVAFGAAMQAVHLDSPGDIDAQKEQEKTFQSSSFFEFFKPNLDTFPNPPPSSENAMQKLAFDQTIIDRVMEAEQCLAQEDFDGALERLGQAMEFFNARRALVYLAWGQYFEKKGKLDRALNKYQQATKLDHENPDGLQALETVKTKIRRKEAHLDYKRGQELEAEGDLSGAFKSYQSAYEKDATSEHGQAYARMLCNKAYEKIEQIKNYTKQRKRNMAKGALKDAKKYLTDCIRLDPANPEYRNVLDEISAIQKGGQ